MKKTMKLQVIAILALLVLGACNSSQDVASGGFITKRKYNKGFHINLNKKYKSTKGTDVEKIDEQVALNEAIEINEVETTYTLPSTTSYENAILSDAGVRNDAPVVEENINTSAIPVSKYNVAVNVDNKINKVVLKSAKHQFKAKKVLKSNGGDNDLLISLLFIIFGLSFLGVWWHEGKKWTKRCTVNLILWLLCGLPGFIHGLIVVLGDR